MLMTVPEPTGNGWMMNKNEINIKWKACSPAREKVLTFIFCVISNKFNLITVLKNALSVKNGSLINASHQKILLKIPKNLIGEYM